ncbi:MAG: SPOR domain-containing protein [Terriglobia bacterium]
MNYEFSLDKKKTAILLAGLGLLGVLLFLAGFLIGYGLRPSAFPFEPLAQHLSKVKLAPGAPAAVAATGGSFAKPAQATPANAGPGTGAGNQAQAPANTPPPVPAPAAASAPNPPFGPGEASTGEPTQASSPAQATDPAPKAYSIQMGAFLDPNNAARLVKNLKDLGYAVTIFKAPDRRGRIWEAVRFGRFTDLQSAMRAAAGFRAKEQIFALVRPANTL